MDVVLASPCKFPMADGHYDVLFRGQAFEHVKFFWLTWMETVRTEYGNVDCLEAHTDWGAYPFAKGRVWGDTVGAFAKAPYQLTADAKRWVDGRKQAEKCSLADRAASEVTRAVEGTLRSAKRSVAGPR